MRGRDAVSAVGAVSASVRPRVRAARRGGRGGAVSAGPRRGRPAGGRPTGSLCAAPGRAVPPGGAVSLPAGPGSQPQCAGGEEAAGDPRDSRHRSSAAHPELSRFEILLLSALVV